jgi:predicted AAA+ superfamily ATPase
MKLANYYRRTVEKTLDRMNKTFPVVLITGPRQVGKTTI